MLGPLPSAASTRTPGSALSLRRDESASSLSILLDLTPDSFFMMPILISTLGFGPVMRSSSSDLMAAATCARTASDLSERCALSAATARLIAEIFQGGGGRGAHRSVAVVERGLERRSGVTGQGLAELQRGRHAHSEVTGALQLLDQLIQAGRGQGRTTRRTTGRGRAARGGTNASMYFRNCTDHLPRRSLPASAFQNAAQVKCACSLFAPHMSGACQREQFSQKCAAMLGACGQLRPSAHCR